MAWQIKYLSCLTCINFHKYSLTCLNTSYKSKQVKQMVYLVDFKWVAKCMLSDWRGLQLSQWLWHTFEVLLVVSHHLHRLVMETRFLVKLMLAFGEEVCPHTTHLIQEVFAADVKWVSGE